MADTDVSQSLLIEAETFASLGDFRIETLGGIASNGAGIRLPLGSEGAAPDVSGTASTAFTGASGTYAIKVRYFDEGDGQAGLSLAVNGVAQASWTLDASGVGWTPDSGNGRTYTLSGIDLKTGDTIALTGTRDGEEYARVDYVEFVPDAAPPPEEPPPEEPPPGDVQTLRIEAEDFASLGDFRTETLGGIASNGAGIRLPLGSEGAAPDASATASTAFTGGSGTYAITVRYFDEGDGLAGLSLAVNGVAQASWTLDASGVGWTPDSGNGRTYTLSGIDLKTGDTIALTGTRNGEEYARVDYVEFVPDAAPPPEEPPPEEPPPGDVQTLRIEAEDFASLGDFRTETLGGIASNGAGIRLPLGSEGAAPDASATASTAFTGASGTYAIKVRYFDEGDGQAGLSLAVNGVAQASWTLDASGVGWTPDSGNGRTYTLSGIDLKTGDTIALTGTRDGEEYARVDYVEFVPASGDDTGGGGGAVGTEAIMPLGDSITDGDNNGGYRGFLYKQLTADSYDVDFVGTLERGASDVDPDHEGHSGWTIGQIHANLTTFLDLNPPETVLLMIGTNNILGGQSAEDATAALSNLLNTLFDQAPEVDLFLGELTPIDPDRWSGATPEIAAEAEAYNALLPGVVSAQQTQGHSVTLVPMDNITTADLVDGVHPGQGGFATIADNYYQAMLGTDALDDALLL